MKNFLLLLFLRFLVWNCRLACNLMAVEISIDHMSGIGTITTSSYQQAPPRPGSLQTTATPCTAPVTARGTLVTPIATLIQPT